MGATRLLGVLSVAGEGIGSLIPRPGVCTARCRVKRRAIARMTKKGMFAAPHWTWWNMMFPLGDDAGGMGRIVAKWNLHTRMVI